MDPQLRAFATDLLDDDKLKRLKNIRKLKSFVSTNSEAFEKADYFKLWEALFFAMWGADTPSLQRRVGCDFCQLIAAVPYERVETWFDAFWFVLQREWEKLDRYRVEKFQLLMRMFLAESIHWLKLQEWKDEAVTKLVSSWKLGPLKPLKAGETYSRGIVYYLVEVLMEELNHERKNEEKFTNAVLIKILEPFLNALCYSDDVILGDKIQDLILSSLDPSIEGEIESIGEWLFEKAVTGKLQTNSTDQDSLRIQKNQHLKVSSIYKAIEKIDTALSTVGRQANYAAVIERFRSELPETSSSASVLDLSAKAKKVKREPKNSKKQKQRKGVVTITKVYTTRRKRIVKKKRIGK